jgi:hypothetical protein
MLLQRSFLTAEVDRVALIRQGLYADRVAQATALQMLEAMPVPERVQLFAELIDLSLAHGLAATVRKIIRSLPRDWVLAHIEPAAEPYLREGTDDEYRRFLELYSELDRDLTAKLARRAAAHTDPDIKEAGAEFLQDLVANGAATPAPAVDSTLA